jgi:transcription-repair coupling factor (superfamily II helicase)
LELRPPKQASGARQEVLVLEFADDAKLYVPLEQAYLVSRYVGVGKKSPPLSSLADAKWARAKKNATASIFDYAGKMLALQAERQTNPGHAFGADTKWQAEFEHSFPYRETPDQLTAIIDTKTDMEQSQPMDRLICGDVGFGKTEVAIRAAFKAVMEGKQVAVLAPTTVLAQQHFETFRQRMLDYPIRIEMLSRFRSPAEQKKVLQLLLEGGVDIVIGTHRLISGDVRFKDLGLVVIDEEQRFGVLHKEKFKELFKLVDVLTLSATPIPRTLYLSLVGVKDMSTIETPPQNRLPVETVVCGYDERIIRDAINRELERQGQVFFLHNRVHSIEKVRDRIAELCPNARVEFGHGQMDSDELEAVMHRFVMGKIDVLVCTTIIESGLDIPNANTIIIDRADRFGLADLYQLRGRVGGPSTKPTLTFCCRASS